MTVLLQGVNLMKKLNTLLIIILVTLLNSSFLVYASEQKVMIEYVPCISQLPELPTGCESTAAAMLLNWAGVEVTKEEIARKLPKGELIHFDGTNWRGGNPNDEFIGDPFTKFGYGVFNKPIENIINEYLPGQALNLTEKDFNEILEAIDMGNPVIAWISLNLNPVKEAKTWYDKDFNEVKWKVPEHVVVIVGYTEKNVVVNDPYTGKQIEYPKDLFETRWIEMGRHAVSIEDGSKILEEKNASSEDVESIDDILRRNNINSLNENKDNPQILEQKISTFMPWFKLEHLYFILIGALCLGIVIQIIKIKNINANMKK